MAPVDQRVGRPKGTFTQYHRLSRLRELLESHPKGLTIAELAERLKVTQRSIRRYLAELHREVDVERGPARDQQGFAVRIASRDLPRAVRLHRTQIYGLLMARRIFRLLEGTSFEEMLRKAVDQMLALVQKPPRRGAQQDPETRLEDRFLYLPATPMRPLTADGAEQLDSLIDACAQLRICRIKYLAAGRDRAAVSSKKAPAAEELTVHPYAVVLYKDTLYCVAWVEERAAIRTLRSDRMLEVDLQLRTFQLPADFSVDAHFAGQFGVHTGSKPTRVVIDFLPRVADYVRTRRFPGEDGADATFEDLDDGGLRLTMCVGSTTEVRSWVLSFGETARVVEPKELADDVVRELRGALAAYV